MPRITSPVHARLRSSLAVLLGLLGGCSCGESAAVSECEAAPDCGLEQICNAGHCADADSDADGVPDRTDNCALVKNPLQENQDVDGQGDACDPDRDGDGLPDATDVCPLLAEADQADLDHDGIGDRCDDDVDGDHVPNGQDNCPRAANADQKNADHDGLGDVCDPDLDGDGVPNGTDDCPFVPDPDQIDADHDGLGVLCDDSTDTDHDGRTNDLDNCLSIPNPEQADQDGDGIGDACDGDLDGDDVPNETDDCPQVSNADQSDLDGDGLGDVCDPDDDGDATPDATDNCPRAANADQADGDGDGTGDACDDAGTRTGQPADPHCRQQLRRPFQTKVKWQWPGTQTLPAGLTSYTRVMMTPVVGDLDADSHPDVAFVAYSPGSLAGIPGYLGTGALVVVDGRDGKTKWMLGPPASAGQVFLSYGSQLAIGNLDNSADKKLEIVAIRDYQGTATLSGGPIVFDSAGALLWSCRATNNCVTYADQRSSLVDWGGVSLADLDHDGVPEIVYGATVYKRQANGSYALLWNKHDAAGTETAGSGSNGVGPLSVVADLDLDGTPEVIAGRTVYRANGSTWWDSSARDGFPAVGNFDSDPNPEIVLVSTKLVSGASRGIVSVSEHDGRVKWTVDLPGLDPGRGGPPTVADFDGDGSPEIGVAAKSLYTVFDTDGSVLWSHPTQDVSSSTTGSSVFDFEGDGFAEVVYNDELHLRVFDGIKGDVLYEQQNTSATAYEYPVIADADADGHADIVVAANPYCATSACTSTTGVTMYVSNSTTWDWVPTRKIWNQHGYSVTNVHDDGSIASPATSPWTPATFDGWPVGESGGSFRNNAAQPPAGVYVPLADLQIPWTAVDGATCPAGFTLRAWIDNRGAAAVPAGVKVAVYKGVLARPTCSSRRTQPRASSRARARSCASTSPASSWTAR